MHTVNLRHKYKSAKCRFILVPGEDPAVLGMPDTELLNILGVTSEVISKPHESGKFDLQTIEVSNSPVAEQTEPCEMRQSEYTW